MAEQKFGGPWTEKKLKALEAYLKAYLRIFTSNPSAQHFTRHYVDAFAGSGLRHTHSQPALPLKLPKDGDVLNEAQAFMEGSVRKVLSLDDPFHNYWFIENNVNYAKHLKDSIKSEFPDRFPLCHIETQDSNEFLINWSESLGRNDRAVVFLDPYGMQV
ncbi:MAG: three-Cys-motif partner protein TcmP, partial [Candidatus Korarchaeota archaeon]|nr:three-Cys-motif partner protein TcmP [Candidatus Korarchaeota archaeon]NIR17249.1 three-Cys-motif partner protein TcmP [Desulfobacterales bacterium]